MQLRSQDGPFALGADHGQQDGRITQTVFSSLLLTFRFVAD